MKNELRVSLTEFKRVAGRFKEYGRQRPKRPKAMLSAQALVAFAGGFLSFEVDGLVAAARAEGEWHGRGWIAARMLGVMAASPPIEDPVVIRYDGERLWISTVSMRCEWSEDGGELVERLENPEPLDLLAMSRTLSRAEYHGSPIGKRISNAERRLSNAITRSARLLADFEVTDKELRDLVEVRIQQRIRS